MISEKNVMVGENKGVNFQVEYVNLTIWFLSQVDLAQISVFYFIFNTPQTKGRQNTACLRFVKFPE